MEELNRHLEHLASGEDPPRGGSAGSTVAPSTGRGGATSSSCPAEPEDGLGAEGAGVAHAAAAARVEDPMESLRGAQRAHWELQQRGLPHGCRIEPSPGSAAQFFVTIDIAEGPYTPATLVFWLKVFDEFPSPDSVSARCTQRVFHPCVDPASFHLELPAGSLEGVGGGYALHRLLSAIRGLFAAPVDAPARNAEAAMLLQSDPDEFRRAVRMTLAGGEYGGTRFDRVLGAGPKASAPLRPARAAGAAQAPPDAGRREKAEKMKVDLMTIEVMKDQFKAQADVWQQANSRELRELGAPGPGR